MTAVMRMGLSLDITVFFRVASWPWMSAPGDTAPTLADWPTRATDAESSNRDQRLRHWTTADDGVQRWTKADATRAGMVKSRFFFAGGEM